MTGDNYCICYGHGHVFRPAVTRYTFASAIRCAAARAKDEGCTFSVFSLKTNRERFVAFGRR